MYLMDINEMILDTLQLLTDRGFGYALLCCNGNICLTTGLTDHKPLLFLCQTAPPFMKCTFEFRPADCFF